jgi:hypothetical protein
MHLIFLSKTVIWFQSPYSEVSTTDYGTNRPILLSVEIEELKK